MGAFKNHFLKIDEREFSLRRRSLLLILATLPAACVAPLPNPRSAPVPGPTVPPKMRQMQLGQQWVYAVRNVYNQELVDVITETVVEIGTQVRIQRISKKTGVLPDEIQSPSGMIVQDPHWCPAQIFLTALPLWPLELKPGWQGQFRSHYEVINHPGYDYYWLLSIKASDWEEISTSAGHFQALRIGNHINFQSDDFSRFSCERMETLWLVPEVGRWALRRSTGTYYNETNRGVTQEDYLQWELESWK
jgi:hypothetical protein